MSLVKLDLANMTATAKAQFGVVVGAALADHEVTFPEQPVGGADLMDYANGVAQAIADARAARMTWLSKVAEQNQMIATLDEFLRQTANYVQSVSNGNAAIIELASLPVRQPNGKIGRLAAPLGFVAMAATNPGMVTLKWTPVKHAKGYVVQYAPGAPYPATFPYAAMTTKAKVAIKDLTSATRYWFRVAANSPAGLGDWTDPISVVTQ